MRKIKDLLQGQHNKACSEDGMLLIEAAYVMVVAVLVVFLAFNAGIIFYNRIVITSIANEAAASAGDVYGAVGKDPYIGYVSPDFFEGRNVYRYLRGSYGTTSGDSVVELDMDSAVKKKMKWYAGSMVYTKEMSFDHDVSAIADGISVDIDRSLKDVAVPIASVSITRQFRVLSLNPMAFFGFDPKYTVSAVGSAYCYDPIHQMNLISFVNTAADSFDLSKIDNIVKVFNKIKGMISKKDQ